MPISEFELQLGKLIENSSIEEITIFVENEKKKNYKEEFLKLYWTKTKEIFSKKNNFSYDILGINPWNRLEFSLHMYEKALEHNRIDVIQFLFNNNLIETKALDLYFKIMAQSKVETLKEIMSMDFFKEKLNEYLLTHMLDRCINYDNVGNFEVLLEHISDIDKIANTLLITAAKSNANTILKNLLNEKYSKRIDINYTVKTHSLYDGVLNHENIFTIACKNNNKELIEYIFNSENLIKKLELSKNFIWVQYESNSEDIVEFLILEIKIPYTAEIQKEISNLKESRKFDLINLFEKVRLKNELEENLIKKETKSKFQKL